MPFEYEAIRAKAQQILADFLNAELKIGNTFSRSALLAYDEGHMEHYEQAKRYSARAADSVRRFMSEVTDAKSEAKSVCD